MPRGSRNGAATSNVQALDNIDLDEMFNEDADVLFDGIDIDMSDMGDITSGNLETKPGETLAGDAKEDAGGTTASATAAKPPSVTSASPTTANAAEEAAEEQPRRRKTTRKRTAPAIFDDHDEDFVEEQTTKKKKRTTKAAGTKKRGPKKATATAAATDIGKTLPTPAPATTKKGKASKSTMPPPVARGTSATTSTVSSTSMVAAAGQFGGRQKKSNVSLPMASNKATTSTATSRSTTDSVGAKAGSTKASAPPKTTTEPHPGLNRSSFCGLLPSRTLFYPFMPTMPSEPALKNRKIYALLDRAHTSFMSFTSSSSSKTSNGVEPAKETEPIFFLMQEAFKDEKASSTSGVVASASNGGAGDDDASNATTTATATAAATTSISRKEAIGNAIGALRKTISQFDKTKLAQDLLAVCALLKRQHDFLKQNAANMERWCRDNFNENDYAEVYMPEKLKKKEAEKASAQPVLNTFEVSVIRVKVLCAGFKEPKTTLQAVLPTKTGTSVSSVSTTVGTGTGTSSENLKKTSKLSKKRKLVEDAKQVTTTSSSRRPAPYSQCKPPKRRKMVADLISRTAQALEFGNAKKRETHRYGPMTNDKRYKELAADPNSHFMHTTGMWNVLKEMGYFRDTVGDDELRDKLEESRAFDADRLSLPIEGNRKSLQKRQYNHPTNELPVRSSVDTLMDLLVEEDSESVLCDASLNSEADSDSSMVLSASLADPGLADVSDLSMDERAYLQIRVAGLASEKLPVQDKLGDGSVENGSRARSDRLPSANFSRREESTPAVASSSVRPEMSLAASVEGDSIDRILDAMKQDLTSLMDMNELRASYMEQIAHSKLETPEEKQERRGRESALLSRCAALVKKNKEMKTKAGKKSAKNDDLALPW